MNGIDHIEPIHCDRKEIDKLWSQLRELAKDSPVIHTSLAMGQIHRITREETLLRLAIAQEEMRKAMFKQLMDMHCLSTRAHIIPVEIQGKDGKEKTFVPYLAMPLNQDSING